MRWTVSDKSAQKINITVSASHGNIVMVWESTTECIDTFKGSSSMGMDATQFWSKVWIRQEHINITMFWREIKCQLKYFKILDIFAFLKDAWKSWGAYNYFFLVPHHSRRRVYGFQSLFVCTVFLKYQDSGGNYFRV